MRCSARTPQILRDQDRGQLLRHKRPQLFAALPKTAPAAASTLTCSPRLHFFFLGSATRPGAAGGCPDVCMGAGQPFARRRSSSHPSVLAGRGAASILWESSRRLVSGRIPGALRHSYAYSIKASTSILFRHYRELNARPAVLHRRYFAICTARGLIQLLVLRIDPTCNACAHSAIGLAQSCT